MDNRKRKLPTYTPTSVVSLDDTDKALVPLASSSSSGSSTAAMMPSLRNPNHVVVVTHDLNVQRIDYDEMDATQLWGYGQNDEVECYDDQILKSMKPLDNQRQMRVEFRFRNAKIITREPIFQLTTALETQQVCWISFSYTNFLNINDSKFVEAIGTHDYLVHLNLSGSFVDTDAFTQLLDYLSRTQFISQLYLSDTMQRNPKREKIYEALDRFLRNNTSLTSLDISNNNIAPEEAQLVVDAFATNNTLKNLYISDNKIGISHFNKLISTSNLRSLIAEDSIGSPPDKTVTDAICAEMKNPQSSLEVLYLKSCFQTLCERERALDSLTHSKTITDCKMHIVSSVGGFDYTYLRTYTTLLEQNRTLTSLDTGVSYSGPSKFTNSINSSLQKNSRLLFFRNELCQTDDKMEAKLVDNRKKATVERHHWQRLAVFIACLRTNHRDRFAIINFLHYITHFAETDGIPFPYTAAPVQPFSPKK